jgi:cell surface protein SprA
MLPGYQGTYNWSAGPMTADTVRLGNMVENSQNLQLTGNINLNQIYNQIPYFKRLDEKFQRTSRVRGSMAQTGQQRQTAQQPCKPPILNLTSEMFAWKLDRRLV